MTLKSEIVADIESGLDALHECVARHRRGRAEAVQAAIDGGHVLTVLRERAQHGDWAAWCERAGLTERTAYNWRKLAASGWDVDRVLAYGGIAKTLKVLSLLEDLDAALAQEREGERQMREEQRLLERALPVLEAALREGVADEEKRRQIEETLRAGKAELRGIEETLREIDEERRIEAER